MIVWEGFIQGLRGVWMLARVVIPLMMVLEIAKHNNYLKRVNTWLYPAFSRIGLSQEGVFPVIVAIIFGLTFGSSVIIANLREGRISPQETRIIGAFIALCHAIVEDTFILLAIGAPLWILLFPRFFAAILVSAILHRWYSLRQVCY